MKQFFVCKLSFFRKKNLLEKHDRFPKYHWNSIMLNSLKKIFFSYLKKKLHSNFSQKRTQPLLFYCEFYKNFSQELFYRTPHLRMISHKNNLSCSATKAKCFGYFYLKKLKILDQTADAQPGIFRGRRGFLVSGHLDKSSMYKYKRSVPQRNNLEFFSPRYS